MSTIPAERGGFQRSGGVAVTRGFFAWQEIPADQAGFELRQWRRTIAHGNPRWHRCAASGQQRRLFQKEQPRSPSIKPNRALIGRTPALKGNPRHKRRMTLMRLQTDKNSGSHWGIRSVTWAARIANNGNQPATLGDIDELSPKLVATAFPSVMPA